MNARVNLSPDAPVQVNAQPVRVLSTRWLADGVLRFEFAALDGRPLPDFSPGAHVDVHLPGGLVRSYSLLGDGTADGRYAIAVQLEREGRGGSRALHGVRAGEVLALTGPRNLFELAASTAPVVLIAGGIGITPLLGMAERCERTGVSWAMHASARSRPALLFQDWMVQHAGKVHVHCNDEAAGCFLDLQKVVDEAPAGAHFYCCGPGAMLDAFLLATQALPTDRVHIERFAPAAPVQDVAGLEVELPLDGVTVVVPEGTSILHALLDAGVDIPYACEQGICGMCEVRVREGDPVHRDHIKTPEEHQRDGTMMVCCSGARSARLVIER